MDARQQDPRTRRTLALLGDAMTDLLRSRTLTEISVSELCRRAGVHRTTFYNHFSSVAQFAATTFSDRIDEIAAVSEEDLPPDAEEVPLAYERAMAGLLDHVAKDRGLYRSLFAAEGDVLFQRIVADLLSTRALRAHRALVARGRNLDVDEVTAARMVGSACSAALGTWAEQEETDSERRAAEIMAALPHWWHGS